MVAKAKSKIEAKELLIAIETFEQSSPADQPLTDKAARKGKPQRGHIDPTPGEDW